MTINKFLTQPYYFLSYFSCWTLALWAVIGFLIPTYEGSWWLVVLVVVLLTSMRYDAQFLAFIIAILLSPDPIYSAILALTFLPITVAIGISAACLIHNVSHNQLKNRYSNIILGEFLGLLLKTNFLGWKLVHYYHHRYADNSEKDPHSPGNMSYWAYANSMQMRIVSYLDARHADKHHLPKALYVVTALIGTLLFAGIPLFWVLVLGPTLFVSLWLPMSISAWWLFICINYYSHPPMKGGGNEVVNLDSKLWHKFINFLGFGILYHKNHHGHAIFFNPKTSSKQP